MSESAVMERVEGPVLEVLGPCPCPAEGCDGVGSRVRVGGSEVVAACAACSEAAELRLVEEERRERVEHLLAVAGGTQRLAGFTLDSYPTDPAARQAKQVALDWRAQILADRLAAPNLVMFGPVGCGKTGLLWPIVESLCRELVPARMVDFPSLLEEMKDSFAKRVPFERHSSLARSQVLVLDDVGAERPTEWACGQLLNLVNFRYENRLTTAYLSNYEPDELAARLGRDDPLIGERIVSRMNEGAIQHRIVANDRR